MLETSQSEDSVNSSQRNLLIGVSAAELRTMNNTKETLCGSGKFNTVEHHESFNSENAKQADKLVSEYMRVLLAEQLDSKTADGGHIDISFEELMRNIANKRGTLELDLKRMNEWMPDQLR